MHRWLNKRSKIKLFMVTEPAKLSRKSPIYLYPIYLNPIYLNPIYLNPIYLNPIYLNPIYFIP
ncbi:hypothetical protein [Shewanella vaxholmensis]|uniref:hypothetical protein n=1 Tax=Shewanella vaxholmensis TaxID=3063535 RepID=UPI00318B6986